MKKWYKSKTIWINFFISLLTVVEANFEFIKANSSDKYMIIVLTTTALNFWLRTITTESIKEKK